MAIDDCFTSKARDASGRSRESQTKPSKEGCSQQLGLGLLHKHRQLTLHKHDAVLVNYIDVFVPWMSWICHPNASGFACFQRPNNNDRTDASTKVEGMIHAACPVRVGKPGRVKSEGAFGRLLLPAPQLNVELRTPWLNGDPSLLQCTPTLRRDLRLNIFARAYQINKELRTSLPRTNHMLEIIVRVCRGCHFF